MAEQIVPVISVARCFDDLGVQFVPVPGTRGRQAALVVCTPRRTALVLNDLVGNIQNAAAFDGWLLHIAGVAGNDAHILTVVETAVITDTNALRDQSLQWAETGY